jgi:heme A synthase
MQTIFMAHSGLRYLVLLLGVLAVAYFAYAVASKGGNPKVSRVLGSVFTGVLDLQVLLGLILVALGLYYPTLLGHLFMMLFAAAAAHVAMALAKSSPDPARANRLRLAGVVLALLLIAGGVMAIGRGLLESGVPSIS